MATVAAGSTAKGFQNDPDNSRLNIVYNGTRIASYTSSGQTIVGTFSASTTLTAGTGLVVTAGDGAITAGNLRLGAINTFGTTEPTSAVVMKVGTAPAGAITTSNAIFSAATVVQKIIAAGTVSNIET